MLTAIDYFQDTETVTSSFLAGSVGANPVIIRNVMRKLKEAGIIRISQGKTGIVLAKELSDITFYDVYKAVDCIDETGLFHFHEEPNIDCPVGRNIHNAMDAELKSIQNAMEERMKLITVAGIEERVRERTDVPEKSR